jgi:hypothetical protein
MYTYPQALDAMHKIFKELLFLRYPSFAATIVLNVVPDPVSGTASVSWECYGAHGRLSAVTVRMPVLPANYKMSAQEFDDYAGLILHEFGHPVFTDDASCDRARREGFFKLLNALEDVRMEKAVIDAKIVANAQTVFEKLVYSLDYRMGRDEFDANASRNIGLVMAFLGRHANGYAIDASIITKKIDPNGKVAKVLGWALPALMKCADTNACLILARRIQKALPKDKAKEPEKGRGEATEGQKGEPQKGEQGEGQQTDQPSTEKGEKKGEPQQSQDKGEAQKDAPVGGGAGEEQEPLTDADIESADIRPENPKALTKENSANAQTEANIIQAIRQAQAKADKPFKKAQNAQPVLANAIAQMASTATRQRALLARALKRNEDDLYEGGLKHGKFDRRAAANMRAGSVNVFGRREMIDGYETDCVILVDGSGSMCLGNIDKATIFALVVAQAAAQVGVACSTYVFGTNGSGFASNGLVAINEGRSRPDAAKFAHMIEIAGGGTPLSPSMLAVAQKQVVRARGKRKVMFVISDGMCSSGPNTLKGVATYIEQSMGVELAHMSIGNPLRGCFRNEVYVNPQDDVANVGLTSLVKALEAGV